MIRIPSLALFCVLFLCNTVYCQNLLFQTGFEGTTTITQNSTGNDRITGTDNLLPVSSSWEDFENNYSTSKFYINYTGGNNNQRFAKIISEPGNPTNKVLQFLINEPWAASDNQTKARVQLELYNLKLGIKELYQSVRVYIHPDFELLKSYPKKIEWFTLSEFWNNEWWSTDHTYGFRVTLNIGKESSSNGDLIFMMRADEDPDMRLVWEAKNVDVKVPIGKWFTMEYYLKEGNANSGRYYMAITPDGETKQVIFNVTNFTHNTTDPNPNGFTFYNPLKMYTSSDIVNYMKNNGKALQIYWDDLKIWKDKTPEMILSILNNNESKKIIIAPNPLENEDLKVLIKDNILLKGSTIRIANLAGQILFQSHLLNNEEIITNKIFNSGLYFLSIEGPNTEKQVLKIIVKKHK